MRTAEGMRRVRAANHAAGLCYNAADHGPAVAYGLCKPCKAAARRYARNGRKRRIADGVCAIARAHGPATHGVLCEECHAKRQVILANHRERHNAVGRARYHRNKRPPMCLFGASHGPAVSGIWCAKCTARRAAAQQRLDARTERAAPAPQAQPPRERKTPIRAVVERNGSIDSTGLLDLLTSVRL